MLSHLLVILFTLTVPGDALYYILQNNAVLYRRECNDNANDILLAACSTTATSLASEGRHRFHLALHRWWMITAARASDY